MANDQGEEPADVDDVVGGTVDDVQKGCFGSLLILGFIGICSVALVFVIWLAVR